MPVLEQLRSVVPESPVSIVHLATRESGFTVALCGKKRDRPLNPSADGELCVVCAAMSRRAA